MANDIVTTGTSAEYAYDLYVSKQKEMDRIMYECKLLIDKYHSEMCKIDLPFVFKEASLRELFSSDYDVRNLSRKAFLDFCFSEDFLKKNNVDFVHQIIHGYSQTARTIEMGIGEYLYSVEIPIPKNIVDDKDKEFLMGRVKFRADRLLKSHANDFCKQWEAVQMPTYNWKQCFKAIEECVCREG